MGATHPEVWAPLDQVRSQLKLIVDRIRKLESKKTPLPLSVAPASVNYLSTNTAAPFPMWRFTGVVPAGWQAIITAVFDFDTDNARGGAVITDTAGEAVASSTTVAGQTVTFQIHDAPMPLLLSGYTNAGFMSVTITQAQVAPWSGDTLDTGE